MKKRIIMFLIILFLPTIIFSVNNDEIKENLNDNLKQIDLKENMKGPVGKPFVKGPTSNPPTTKEVLSMRRIEEEEKNFFEKVWEWIINLFN